jgi:hypothetical protein
MITTHNSRLEITHIDSVMPNFVFVNTCINLKGRAWKCDCDCFLKCFLCRNASNDVFFIFLKLFLRSAHQNNPKHI